MEFMDHLYQFGQFGILTSPDGIQEVSGLVSLISAGSYLSRVWTRTTGHCVTFPLLRWISCNLRGFVLY